MANNGLSPSSSQPRPPAPGPVTSPTLQLHNGHHNNGVNVATRGSRKSTVSSIAASTHSLSTPSLSASNRQSDNFQYRAVRTLPTWVQEYDEDVSPTDLITPPPPLAHKSNRPPGKSIHDSRRDHEPVTMGPTMTAGSRWRTFVEDSHHRPVSQSQPPLSQLDEKVGQADWLLEEGGNLEEPWLANQKKDAEDGEKDGAELLFVSSKRRRIWYKRMQIMLLNNPMVPLGLRASIWILSLFALAFASSVFSLSNKYDFPQKPSTIMAIVVDVVAMVYLIYITYDEYSGKPLGLRSPKAKMRLIMFDLFFIIFDSANTALAFDSLFDAQWSCVHAANASSDFGNSTMSLMDDGNRVNVPICRRQRALASFLFLALCAWVSTFTISVFRLVERVSRNVG